MTDGCASSGCSKPRSNSRRPSGPRSCRLLSRGMKRCAGKSKRCSRPTPPAGPLGTVAAASESLAGRTARARPARCAPGDPSSPGLTAGNRLGNYDVVAPLGAGGMGEVYRAHDARLGRDVAIKILPRAFTTDPDRLARFEREARVLASLNHPHIAGIYGIEETGALPRSCWNWSKGRRWRTASEAGRIARRRSARDRAADRRRALGRARQGHRPSRSQAGQHQGDVVRRGQGPRLRTGQSGRRGRDAGARALTRRSR